MANFSAATSTVNVFNTVELAAANLETLLEATDDAQVIEQCAVLQIGARRYAAILVTHAAAA